MFVCLCLLVFHVLLLALSAINNARHVLYCLPEYLYMLPLCVGFDCHSDQTVIE